MIGTEALLRCIQICLSFYFVMRNMHMHLPIQGTQIVFSETTIQLRSCSNKGLQYDLVDNAKTRKASIQVWELIHFPATPLSNPASCLCAKKVNKRLPKVFWVLHPVTYMDGSCLGSGPDLAIDMIWDGQGRGGERKEVVKQWIRDTSLFHAHSLTFTLALTLWLYLSNK